MLSYALLYLAGTVGIEPTTSRVRAERSAKLNYAPKVVRIATRTTEPLLPIKFLYFGIIIMGGFMRTKNTSDDVPDTKKDDRVLIPVSDLDEELEIPTMFISKKSKVIRQIIVESNLGYR